ncbi:YktB family protein [Salinithrix halophila]|uniref:UPF0637 protein ACFOUO_07155 n=1 Tax=Salinithrix halophila TaxID=1485204 RepID=A0ABV8JCG8_9BACL
MAFTGFEISDFDVFTIPGLDPRMEELRERVRPKLQALGEAIAPRLSEQTGETMYVHVAKHARRSVNPPDETWVAWSDGKRGYKSRPHFQVGLREANLFGMFALIYEYPNKPGFARDMLEQLDEILPALPGTFVVSPDHTKPETHSLTELGKEGLEQMLKRLGNVKKAEFLIGIELNREDPTVRNGEKLIRKVEETFTTLQPLYQIASLA